jgi:hypothetical protein
MACAIQEKAELLVLHAWGLSQRDTFEEFYRSLQKELESLPHNVNLNKRVRNWKFEDEKQWSSALKY